MPPPAYFPLNVMLNKKGYEDFEVVLKKGQTGMSPSVFEEAATSTGAIILDVRHQDNFTKSHIPRSIFIGIDGGFAPWVGVLIKDIKQPILLVAAQDRLEEVITRLSRVGFDNVLGYLEGGIESWKEAGNETDSIKTISAEEFSGLSSRSVLNVYDVRKESEFLSEHVVNATNTSLDNINAFLDEFQTEGPNYIHCAGGYRSVIAESILKSRGIHNLVDVRGGFGAVKKTDAVISDFVCPSTL
jgi:hydroxyacylglutathione hydrolase